MKEFKFFRDNDNFLTVGDYLTTFLPQRRYNEVEFCFKFDDDEPTIFARGSDEINIRIEPTDGGNIKFTTGDKNFTIFARERQ